MSRWIIFGGSYGSTLALAYAIKYKQHVQHLVLRGIFLGRQSDIDWLFKFGASEFFPQAFDKFKNFISKEQQTDLVTAYYELMTSGDQDLFEQACMSWNQWESSVIHHLPVEVSNNSVSASDLSIGLLEAHYFHHKMFWEDDNYILNNIEAIKDLPIDIFHGRYDVDCRLSGAMELQDALNNANLHIVEAAGHSPYESLMFAALVNKMDELGQ
ncbi:alpha/beta fold hydrolase [Aerococcaceae bacterium WGS1372]